MWFGPKGFASVVYGLLVLQAGIPAAGTVFDLVALTIVASILADSSTRYRGGPRVRTPGGDADLARPAGAAPAPPRPG
jgi:hypothetical protein